MTNPKQNDRQAVLQCTRDLAAAAQVDTLYRDLFLQRAAAKLRTVLSEAAYREAGELEPRIAVLLAENRRAVDRQDWVKVKSISEQVAELQRKLLEATAEVEVAKQVYEAAPVAVDPLCVELQPLLKDQMTVNAARQAALQVFERLAAADPEWAEFHRQRRAYFEGIQTVQAGGDKAPGPKRVSSVAQLRQEAHKAAAAGDVARLAKLADEILAAENAGQSTEEGAPRAATPALMQVPADIQKPFDPQVVEKAAALGLAHVEIKPESAETATKVADFVRQHQWRTAGAAAEIVREGTVRLNSLMREIQIPADIAEPVSTAILMFAINPFVNSAGVRYLVHFASEYVLVENFPETSEPANDELLKALGLPQRRGLARLEIEGALREHGPALLKDRLGLEPKDYRLVCVPYDVYLRAGRDLGWGQQPHWTHVDGYQLGRGGRMRALVAGDARHGGLFDLCAIGADDGREGVMSRFAIVRRARMLIGRS